MNHETEFSDNAKREEVQAKRLVQAELVAKAYARLFSSDDGKRVINDLRRKFPHNRDRFTRENAYSMVGAARIDGECAVLREIEQACRAGGAPV